MGGWTNDNDDVKVNPESSKSCLIVSVPFLNGTSDSMNVNGAVTPVNFNYAPASTDTWYVSDISLYIEDAAGSSTTFGAAAALTNGLLLTCQSKGVVQDIATLKTNLDIFLSFPAVKNVSSAAGLLGLGSAGNIFTSLILQPPVQIPLVGGNGDYLRFRVRDNLLGLRQLRARATIYRINS